MKNLMDSVSCEICGRSCKYILNKSSSGFSVTSDSNFMETKSSKLFHCENCDYYLTKSDYGNVNFYMEKYNLLSDYFFQDQRLFALDDKMGRNRYQANLLSSLSANVNTDKICEVGCGKGLTAHYYSKEANYKNFLLHDPGLDTYVPFWEKYIKKSQPLRFLNKNKLQCDLAYSFFVAEHVKDINSYILQCIGLIKESGLFISCLPDLDQNHGDILVSDHLRHTTLNNLNRLLENIVPKPFHFKVWRDKNLRALVFAIGKSQVLQQMPSFEMDKTTQSKKLKIDEVKHSWPINSKERVIKEINDRKIILWGSSFYAKIAVLTLNLDVFKVVDSNPDFHENVFRTFRQYDLKIYNPDILNDLNQSDFAVLLCMSKNAANSLKQELSPKVKQMVVEIY